MSKKFGFRDTWVHDGHVSALSATHTKGREPRQLPSGFALCAIGLIAVALYALIGAWAIISWVM
jgi:hypothetical protein